MKPTKKRKLSSKEWDKNISAKTNYKKFVKTTLIERRKKKK